MKKISIILIIILLLNSFLVYGQDNDILKYNDLPIAYDPPLYSNSITDLNTLEEKSQLIVKGVFIENVESVPINIK